MKVANSQATRPETAHGSYQRTGRILIVDDEPAMVASLAELLTRDGHEVAGAHTEVEAQKLLRESPYDLVIADVVMPDGGGIEVLRAAHDVDGDCPVIMMTAYASVEAAVSAINEGAYDFLVKPIDLTELSLTVRRAVEKRHLAQAMRKLMGDLSEANRTLARRVAELNALHDVSAAMSGTAEVPKLLDRILQAATSVIGARYGSILLLDLKVEGLVVEAATGRPPGSTDEVRVALSDSIAGYVATTG
ncbi:MAG TPA: response regulator, partial [Acidobacteriota bacterium]|nr:response regulator [Acidobacteriota bacterium]